DPNSLSLLLVRGLSYEAKGDRPNARRAYERALMINPRFAAAGNNLAALLADSAPDRDSALKVITAAKAADPNNPAVTDTFGWVLYQRGEYDKAVEALKEAATKLPNEPTVAYHLGMAYAKNGDAKAARRELQRALSSQAAFPERDSAQKALADLK
ncbi:MAG: tetratricopeptide repeat protein, partial [Gemmatimonadaceae bacterium]